MIDTLSQCSLNSFSFSGFHIISSNPSQSFVSIIQDDLIRTNLLISGSYPSSYFSEQRNSISGSIVNLSFSLTLEYSEKLS